MKPQTVGTFEAKARLSELLNRVAEGQTITITRHGRPIAHLVPAQGTNREAARLAIEQWRRLRAGNRLGPGLSIQSLRDEGRP